MPLALMQLALGLPMAYAAVQPRSALPLSGLVVALGLCVLGLLLWVLRQNRRLKVQGQAMSTLLDQTPTPLMVIHSDGRIEGWNAAATELFGWQAEEVLGRPMADLLLPEPERAAVPARLQAWLSEQESAPLEQWNRTKAGASRLCQWQHRVLVLAEGTEPVLLATVTDITRQKAKEQNWVRLAHTDALTGVCNRRHFNLQCRQAMEQAQRQGLELALLFIDLNDFKRVNDRFGHAAGDATLEQVARRLKGALRDQDLLARLGGDEFVVLMAEGGEAQVQAMARRVQQALAVPLMLPRHGEVQIGASIGHACYPRDGATPEALLKVADQSMYRRKLRGKALPLPQVRSS
ncbi:diguanylate cyclase [Ferrimonas balearica]|nr:diguanylate cyclase [Ferrimonas balearica]